MAWKLPGPGGWEVVFPLFDFGSNPHPSSRLTSTMLFSPEVSTSSERPRLGLYCAPPPQSETPTPFQHTPRLSLACGHLMNLSLPSWTVNSVKRALGFVWPCSHMYPQRLMEGRSGTYQGPTIFVERMLLNVTVGRDRGNNPTSPTLLPTLISQLREQTETRHGHSASVTEA